MYRRLLIFFIIATASLMLWSCSSNEQVETKKVDDKIISVKAQVVDNRDVNITRTFTGSLTGEKQAVLYAKIAEAVSDVKVSIGQRVNANDILLTLDNNGPSSNYQQSKSLYLNAEKNHIKMEYLYKEGAVSESQYDAAKTEFEVNKASFEAASQLVNIQTPISGVVTSVDVSYGDFVQVGQKLATVATTEKLRVKFGVNSSEISSFKEGSEIFISSDAVNKQAEGKVISIANSADPTTRVFEVEALIDNSHGFFKPGMFVRINFIMERLMDVIAIPRKSVLTLDGQESVFVIDNGIARKRIVSTGSEIDGHIVINSGIEQGDTLIIVGQDYLDDGFKVNLTELVEGK